MTIPPTLALNGKAISGAAIDNGLAYVYVASNAHARTYLLGLQAAYSASVAAIKQIIKYTAAETPASRGTNLTGTTLSRGTTDTQVQTTATQFAIGSGGVFKAAVAAGTALPAGTIPADTWGIYRVSVNAAGTITVTAGAANYTTGYASEAAAIAAVPAVPSQEANMGYFTVLTASGLAFVAGTDALAGGASGNPATTTNYTSESALTKTQVGVALPWDFGNGPAVLPLPGIMHTNRKQALLLTLEASGTGGTTGQLEAWVSAP